MNILRIIAVLRRGHTLSLLLGVALLTFSGFVEAGAVFGLAPMVDLLIHPDLSNASGITIKITQAMKSVGIPASVLAVMVSFIALLVLKNVLAAAAQFTFTKLHFHLVKNIIFQEFRSFLSASWQFFVSKNYGVLGNTLIRETDKVGLSFEAVVEILSSTMRATFYLGVAFMMSWQVTLIVLCITGIVLVPYSLLGKVTYRIGKAHTVASNEFHSTILETIGAAKLILGYGNQHKSLSRLEGSVKQFVSTAIQFVMIRVVTPLTFEPIGIAILLSGVYLGINYFNVGVSELLVMLFAFKTASGLALAITNQKNVLQNMAPSLEQVYELKAEAERMAQWSGCRTFETLKHGVVFKDVTFAYPGCQPVLRDVNLVIPKRKTIALIGRSGAGKTTLIDVLMGFYRVEHGQVLVDDVPFHELDVITWRQRIGYVPQDSLLFNLSIRENLLWSNSAATEGDLRHVCDLANATEFIEKLPQGLETIAGERGVRLSGGQRQRIALARAMLRKPEILILDEATSALDGFSERLIQKAIENIAKDTTIVVIAHRLATIMKSDYIYVLESGSIIEEGSFESLMEIKGGELFKAAEIQGIRETMTRPVPEPL